MSVHHRNTFIQRLLCAHFRMFRQNIVRLRIADGLDDSRHHKKQTPQKCKYGYQKRQHQCVYKTLKSTEQYIHIRFKSSCQI